MDESGKNVDDAVIEQEQVPAKDVPAAGDMAATMVGQEYITSALFFVVVLFIVFIVVRKFRRSSHSKTNEKGVA